MSDQVTREEYDALFACCTRLTDRIEALEALVIPLGEARITTGFRDLTKDLPRAERRND